MTTGELLDVLADVARQHTCPEPLLAVDDLGGEVIRCYGCSRTVWRAGEVS